MEGGRDQIWNCRFEETHHRRREKAPTEQIKNIKIAHDVWKKLKESYDGTIMVKTAKAYILKEKFSNFKMQKDECVGDVS